MLIATFRLLAAGLHQGMTFTYYYLYERGYQQFGGIIVLQKGKS